MTQPLVFARTSDGRDLALLPAQSNRHGLITGATGTGKTVTLQVLAERFSSIGVPTFMADVKGDLAGLGRCGFALAEAQKRLADLKVDAPAFGASPVTFWDVFGKGGHPVRATISDMGPLVLSRLFNLNETQRGVLSIVFKIADDAGLLLLDTRDLRAMLQFVGENAKRFTTDYGNVSAASIGAIQRALLTVDEQGGDKFFGEPMLDIEDLIQTSADGRGMVNILVADQLMLAPKVYASFLLWMLAELFERLPEVGDLEKPKMVFFFDEAHLLFDDAPTALVDKIEQVVRLIRSKGVGVYFVTQNPLDIPDAGARPARQPRAARPAGVHAARPEGRAHGGRDHARESGVRHRDGHHGTWRWRSARVVPRREGHAHGGGAGVGVATGVDASDRSRPRSGRLLRPRRSCGGTTSSTWTGSQRSKH